MKLNDSRKHRKLTSRFLILLCSLFSLLLISGLTSQNSHLAVTGFFAPTNSQTIEKNSNEDDFNAFMQTLFQNEIVSDTLNLHYTLANPASAEIFEYPVTFGKISSETEYSHMASLENLKSELQTFDTSSMSASCQIAYDVLEDSINRNLTLAPYYYYDELLSSTNGIQSEYPILLAEYAFYTKKDIENYLALLNQYDTCFQQICEFEKQKAKQGLFMNKTAVDNLIKQCRAYIPEKSEQSFWETTFSERLEQTDFLTESEKDLYIEQNQKALKTHVYPAYQSLIAVLKALRNKGTNAQGLCYFENGKKYYQLLVKSTTGSDHSISKLKQIVESRRKKNLAELSLLSSIQSDNIFSASGNTEKQNSTKIKAAVSYNLLPYQSPEDMIEQLKKQILTAFPKPPSANYTIKTVSKKLEDFLAPAFYLTAPMDQFMENSIYINPAANYNDIELFTTLAHEGYPGHLYQTVYSYSTELPPLRYILYHGGYTEGWATYVEMLSYDYTGLDQNAARALMLNQDATLSLYATIDMGIHYDGWSLADTADFLGTYGITDTSSITKIYQSIIENPANYLKYYIGYLGFLELKAKAKEYYGNDYSELSFHTAVLDMGTAPFYILEKYLPKYYEAAK